jgi:hypothetical protein
MMKPVHPTKRAIPIDRKSASTQVESLLQQQKLTRTNRQELVKGFIFITRNDKKRLAELLCVAKSFGSETDQHCTSLFAKEHDLKRFKAEPTGDGCHWAKAAFPISMNKRTKPNYEEETTRHQRTT